MTEPQSNHIEFEQEVRASFSFLQEEYGFLLADIETSGYSVSIRYESESLYVEIHYGPPEYHVSIGFGRKGVDEAPEGYSFEAGDLVLLPQCSGVDWNVDGPTKISHEVRSFAKLLRDCGSECLKGSPEIYRQMKATRDSAVERWREREHVKQVRTQMEKAWETKDYPAVVQLSSQIRPHLSLSEQKKVAIAAKYMGRSESGTNSPSGGA